MKCRLEFPPDVHISDVVKGANGIITSVVLEPLFFKADGRPVLAYLTGQKDSGEVIGRSVLMVSGKTGQFCKADRNAPVKPQFETGVAGDDDE